MCIGIVYTLHIAHSCCLWKAVGTEYWCNADFTGAALHRSAGCSCEAPWLHLSGSRAFRKNQGALRRTRSKWRHEDRTGGIWAAHFEDMTWPAHFPYLSAIFTLYSLASWSSCQWGPLLASRTASRSIRIIQHRSSSILQWMDVLNWKQLWRSASAVSFGPTKLAMLAATSAFSCECWHQKGELAATDLRYKASCLNRVALAPPLHSVSASDDVVSQSIRWQWSEHWDGLRRLLTKRELTELSHSYTK